MKVFNSKRANAEEGVSPDELAKQHHALTMDLIDRKIERTFAGITTADTIQRIMYATVQDHQKQFPDCGHCAALVGKGSTFKPTDLVKQYGGSPPEPDVTSLYVDSEPTQEIKIDPTQPNSVIRSTYEL